MKRILFVKTSSLGDVVHNCPAVSDAARRFPGIEWQASGGVRDAYDLHALSDAGAHAAVSGRALLERRMTTTELEPFLPSA